MAPRSPEVLFSLQIGRAVAALAVVFYHAAIPSHSFFGMPDSVLKLLSLGHLGVDYFFVLSGFIIAHSTRRMHRNATGAKNYFLSRGIRIYVPYLPASIVMIAALTLPSYLTQNTRADFSLIASLFLLPSVLEPALAVAWTLQHEIVFYCLFGLCFFWLKKENLIFLWAIPMVLLPFFDVPRWVGVLGDTINMDFLFGVAACHVYHRKSMYSARHLLLGMGLLLIAASGALLYYDHILPHYRILVGLGFAGVVLSLAYMERTTDFSRFTAFIFLGTASYAIYLTHLPIISVLWRVPVTPPNWYVAFAAMAAISCAGGLAYFRLVETPLIALARKHFLPRKKRKASR